MPRTTARRPRSWPRRASWGAVTIATNMAGRGTDILLGGNPEFLARRAMRQEGFDDEIIEAATGHNEDVDPEILQARERYQELQRPVQAAHRRGARAACCKRAACTSSARNATRAAASTTSCAAGPAARATPAPPSSIISLEDDLMRLFGSERIGAMVDRLGLKDDEPLEAGMLTKQIESAQETH